MFGHPFNIPLMFEGTCGCSDLFRAFRNAIKLSHHSKIMEVPLILCFNQITQWNMLLLGCSCMMYAYAPSTPVMTMALRSLALFGSVKVSKIHSHFQYGIWTSGRSAKYKFDENYYQNKNLESSAWTLLRVGIAEIALSLYSWSGFVMRHIQLLIQLNLYSSHMITMVRSRRRPSIVMH